MVGVYKITNLVNGKVYIGQSTDIEYRWAEHRCSHQNAHLRSAMDKYGLENFNFEVIEILDPADLNSRERYWIAFYDSTNPKKGYNHTSGGEREPGWKHSDSSKEKMSRTCKIKTSQPDYVNPQTGSHVIHKGDVTTRCSDKDLGKYIADGWALGFSEKSKHQGADNRKGEKNGVYGKGYLFAGENNHFYGRHHTPESIQKIKDHMPDTSTNWRGSHHTEESKQKMRGPRLNISGANNPNYGKRGKDSTMYGRKCIHKDGVELRVYPKDLDAYLSDGWQLGRVIIPYAPKTNKNKE